MDKVKFIADISSNHCNDINIARQTIRAAKDAGANYAKFQYWNTDTFINKDAFDNLKLSHQSKWKKSIYDTYKEYQIPDWWIPELYEECNKVSIEFLLSCYDIEKIDEFDKYVKAWKIGSGDIDYIPMLEKIASKGKPVFLACGAADFLDIIKAFSTLCKDRSEIVLFNCNTNYTNDNVNIRYCNLNLFGYNSDLFKYHPFEIKGLSDHTKSIIPIIGSIARGCRYIERHFKLCDNDSPDNVFSLNPKEWQDMVLIANDTMIALGDGMKKIMANEIETRGIQRRSKVDWKRPDMEYLKGLNH